MFLMDHFVPIAHQWTAHRFHVNSSHFRICVKIVRISNNKIISMKTSKVFNFDLFQIHMIQTLWNYFTQKIFIIYGNMSKNNYSKMQT